MAQHAAARRVANCETQAGKRQDLDAPLRVAEGMLYTSIVGAWDEVKSRGFSTTSASDLEVVHLNRQSIFAISADGLVVFPGGSL